MPHLETEVGALARRACKPLIAVVEHEDEDLRKAGIEALVQIGAPAVEPLVVAPKDGDDHAGRYYQKLWTGSMRKAYP